MSLAATRIEPTGIYLRASLSPLAAFLERPDVTDIYVNRPGEVWVESLGGAIERHEDHSLSEQVLMRLARQIAALSHQGISREHPLLSARMPDGSRIQIVAPPATRGPLALAIRRQVVADLSLADYAASHAFDDTEIGPQSSSADDELDALIADRKFVEALSLAVKGRKNILISGGTSSGKTTFLNALLREIPPSERLIFIEDTPELSCNHSNQVGLVSVRGDLGETRVSMNDLVVASLRMRPDRIILGELRGDEAFAFLRAINSGHPGSMTTIHANSPESAVEQLVLLVLQGGSRLTREDVSYFVGQSIGLHVQLDRRDGRRHIRAVQRSFM